MKKEFRYVFIAILLVSIFVFLGCTGGKTNKVDRTKAPAEWIGLLREIAGFPEEKRELPKTKKRLSYVGAGRCVFCHAANYYIWSLTTKHAGAFKVLIEKKENKNEECLPCHTVGFNRNKRNNGYDDVKDKQLLEGVQCENCHGMGSNHVSGVSRLKTNLSENVCSCHSGPRQPTIDEWRGSKHAATLNDMVKSGRAEDRCVKCMSVEAVVDGDVMLKDARHSLTCVTCHNPHMNRHEKELRRPIKEICVVCHTIGKKGGHSQKEMVLGTSIVDGITVNGRGHNTAIGTKCVVCHYYTKEFKSEAEPAITGHDFKANLSLCQSCHLDAGKRRENTQREVREAMAKIKERIDSIDGDKLDGSKKEAYEKSVFILNALTRDGSFGVHNKAHALALIKAANETLNTVLVEK